VSGERHQAHKTMDNRREVLSPKIVQGLLNALVGHIENAVAPPGPAEAVPRIVLQDVAQILQDAELKRIASLDDETVAIYSERRNPDSAANLVTARRADQFPAVCSDGVSQRRLCPHCGGLKLRMNDRQLRAALLTISTATEIDWE
jgi:hypothetical protein